jgi:hypothetical protein
MRNTYYVIDDQLRANSLTSYLSKSGMDQISPITNPDRGEVVGKTVGLALPVTEDGQLEPGQLYESSADPNVRFYLPQYRLNVVDGRYSTRLKWRDEHDDPNGPIAFLVVEVVAGIPPAGAFILQEVPHQALARVAFQMSVQDASPQVPAWPFASFLGIWTNVDPNTRGMTRLEISASEGQSVTFHGFGKCTPTDCDWGLTPAHAEGDTLVARYDFGFKQTVITVRRTGDVLVAELFHHFAQGDGRPDRTEHETLSGAAQSGERQNDGRPVLYIEVGSLNPIGDGVRQARLAISDKRDFDRLYQVMTDGSFNASLEIRLFAVAGRHTWRQVVVGRIAMATQVAALESRKVLFTDVVGQKFLAAPAEATAQSTDARELRVSSQPAAPIHRQERSGWPQRPQLSRQGKIAPCPAQ